jgi:molecular chaperone GrpE
MDTADEDLRAAAPAFFEGIDLTQRELLNAFAKHRIETVVPEKGTTFDPNLHQAMFEVPVPGAASGTIVEVMQAGFTIAGRLLRPALVGVAKAVETA